MREAITPRVHMFVCANRRPDGALLGPGCGEHGDKVYSAMKQAVDARGAVREAWITRTQCLGICPKQGCTVAVVAGGAERIVAEVVPGDATPLLAGALAGAAESPTALTERMEELQREKVVALARRLRPGLTLEDLRNPHDFPELDDPDWHYEDGVLAGIQSVTSALKAAKR
jgi:hypothetical protein